ncbi:MAG: hypothetical protein K2P49_09780 [Oscillospiraceae bacterium]|nr:hypothetical protein [Oscillospiraceae bacterium]
MKKREISLLLSAALALVLCSCAPAGEGPSPSLPLTTPPPEASVPVLETLEPTLYPTPSPAPSSSPDFSAALPDRDYQSWQVGYMEFLTALLQAEQDTREERVAFGGLAADQRGVCCLDAGGKLRMTQVMAMGSESYSLYDVDRDGVPELFVKYGVCEAAFTYQCYTFREGRMVCIGEFDGGHSGLYTHPDKSAVLRSSGHMGYAELYEYPMEDGVLTEEREIFREEDVRDYTPTEEIVPGAEYIEYFYTRRGAEDDSYWTGQTPYTLGKALLLPICDWGVGRPATGNDSERARAAILAALSGEGQVYGVSGDHFNGDVGPLSWEEYVQAITAVPRAQVTAKITAYFWMDMNGDGQEECMLRLESDVRRGEEAWSGEDMVMLSEQGGVVYAYCFDFYERDDFCTDGAIRGYGQVYRLSFWNDQCYRYIAEGAEADPVKWLDGSPLS